jgi:serine/threonine protein kinase
MDSTKEEKTVPKEVYKLEIGETHTEWNVYDTVFKLENKYEIIDALGSGAYGTVVAAEDKECKEDESNIVAIKMIERAFEHPLFAKRTLRELKILRLLSHENVIDLVTIQKPICRDNLELYCVFDIMETDLGSIVKSNQPLSPDHIQFFLYQILRGMKYVHSAAILHRDLKPRNLLVNANCNLKICDFGLSRAGIPEIMKAGAMTDYISTRWYRAPELLCGAGNYNEAVDMWSIGWIFAELLIRRPFLPGDDTENQLELIVDSLGQPDRQFLNTFNEGRMAEIFQEMGNQNDKGDFDEVFAKWDPVAVDLLKSMLNYDPEQRITIDQALEHEFIGDLHYEPDEPTTASVSAFDFDFEMYDLSTDDLKSLIYEEIMLYHSKKAQKKYLSNKKKFPKGMLHTMLKDEKNDDKPNSDKKSEVVAADK